VSRRKESSGALANPVLVGAVTTLVALVAVVLSYNANNGLPFVPTYNVTAIVPDAASLTKGNEVRIGGKRVGVVEDIRAETFATDREATGSSGTVAELSLKLEKQIQPLPADTEVTIRPRSPLGLRYLELRPGRSKDEIPQGGRIPLRQAQPIVELDEAIDAFDAPTRRGLRGVVRELGDGVAGRGLDLNRTIDDFGPFVAVLDPVARNLASPRTNPAGLIQGLQATTAAVAPVAVSLGSLVDGAATTLAAIAAAEHELGQILDESPATEATTTRVLRRVRPVLAGGARLLRDIEPGVQMLPTASRRLASAFEAGTPTLRRAVSLADRLDDTLAALRELATDPATAGSVTSLTQVVTSLEPTLRFLNPFQVRCNYLGLWTRNASSTVSEGDQNGTWFRFITIAQTDEILQRATPAPNLHVNIYGSTGQNGECEVGNEPFLPGQRIGPVPGTQPGYTQATAPPVAPKGTR
jgi:phospholipid/cholesterol/gamma-HCH transport system substrate-binding protein